MCSERNQPARVMVDCSHGNSSKDYTRQGAVLRDVVGQVAFRDAAYVVLPENLLGDPHAGRERCGFPHEAQALIDLLTAPDHRDLRARAGFV